MSNQKVEAIKSSGGSTDQVQRTPALSASGARDTVVSSHVAESLKTEPAKKTEAGGSRRSDQAAQDGNLDSSQLTDELSEELQEEAEAKKTENPEEEELTEAEELERQIQELERQIEQLKGQLEEDLKSGNIEAYQQHLGEMQGLEKQLEGLQTQATAGTTPAATPVPATGNSQSGAAPAASYAPVAGGSPAGSYSPSYAPAASSAPSAGSSGGVPVTNNTRPVAGRPHGLAQIKSTFGEAGSNLVSVKMPAGKDGKMISVTCNAKIADKMKGAFEEIKEKGLSHLIDSFDGCYNYRNKRGGSSLSTHAWGIAFDINASQNPMGSSKQTAGQSQLAAIFEKYGFHQLENDPMHFQYCTGY